MERIRQSRPDYGLGFRVKVLTTFQEVPSSLGSGLSATDLPKGCRCDFQKCAVVPRWARI